MSLKEKLLAKGRQIPQELVEVAGIGPVLVRGLTANQRGHLDDLSAGKRRRDAGTQARLQILAWTLHDEAGQRLFEDLELPTLGELSSEVTEPLLDVALRLSGMTRKDVEDADPNAGRSANGRAVSVV